MNVKTVVYIILIITGILIEIYGITGKNPQLESYFGYGFISLGSLNIVIDFIKKRRDKRKN
jgi:hypothetical protein